MPCDPDWRKRKTRSFLFTMSWYLM